MPNHDLVVIGASAGGFDALREIVGRLPADLPASLIVVMHLGSSQSSALSHILSRSGKLPAFQARDNDPIELQRIYVPTPDHHLMVTDHRVELSHGPRENFNRPAIDPTFRSASRFYGPRVVGIVLSGTGDDGAAGLAQIKKRGGITVVQDPAEALFPAMPENAIEHVAIDHVLPAAQIADLIVELSRTPAPERELPDPKSLDKELASDELSENEIVTDERPGRPSHFACPDCGGVLWEFDDGEELRFRCRVGHAYSVESLLDGQTDAVENALWAALRALSEKRELAERMAKRARERGFGLSAKRHEARMKDAEKSIDVLSRLLKERG